MLGCAHKNLARCCISYSTFIQKNSENNLNLWACLKSTTHVHAVLEYYYRFAAKLRRRFIDLDLAIPKEARVINGFNVGVLKVTISMGNSHREIRSAIRRLEFSGHKNVLLQSILRRRTSLTWAFNSPTLFW